MWHEGTHVDEYPMFYVPGVYQAVDWRRSMERSGYETSADAAEALGMRSLKRGPEDTEIYHRGWSQNQVDQAVDELLSTLSF
jgi:hypothetical protein